MASAVDAMASVLLSELNRLSKLKADDETLMAECMRSKAINDTVKTACALGNLHLHSQMLRMGRDTDSFQPGTLFSDGLTVEKVEKPKELPERKEPYSTDFGGKTTINEHGEFECDDGLDDYTAMVDNTHTTVAGGGAPMID
jgi:hypothetical protein